MPTNISAEIASNVIAQTKTQQAPEASRASAVSESEQPRQTAAVSGNELPDEAVQETAPQGGITPELEQAVSDINAYVQNVSRELQFRVDEALPLGRAVISVVDTETEETIREIPNEQALALAHRLIEEQLESDTSQNVEGLIFSAQA